MLGIQLDSLVYTHIVSHQAHERCCDDDGALLLILSSAFSQNINIEVLISSIRLCHESQRRHLYTFSGLIIKQRAQSYYFND